MSWRHSENKHSDIRLQVAPNFRPSLLENASEGGISDQIEILRNLKIPVLVVFGDDDKHVRPDYLDHRPFSTWGDQVYKLRNARHFVNVDQPHLFNQLLRKYVEDCFR